MTGVTRLGDQELCFELSGLVGVHIFISAHHGNSWIPGALYAFSTAHARQNKSSPQLVLALQG
jgi:hypothetical protein